MLVRLSLIAAASAFAASHAAAAVTTTASTIPADTTQRLYASSDPYATGWVADSTPLTGLQKFNPSLGTLTGVALTTSFGYSYDLTLQAGGVTDPAQPHEAVAEFPYHLRFSVGYSPGASIIELALEDPSVGPLTAAGAANDPPASDFTSGSGTVSASLKDVTSFVDLAEFIGTGDVTALIAITGMPFRADFTTLSNVDGATVEANAGRTAGTVSLQYTYIVPEPAGVALLGLAGLATLARRRG